MAKNLFASILIGEKIDINPVNVTSLLDSVIADSKGQINCSILLKMRLFAQGNYKIFLILDCGEKFKILDSLDFSLIEDDKANKYNKVYELENYYVPISKGNCYIKVFALTNDQFEEFKKTASADDYNSELLFFLETNDCYLLEQEILYIDQND